MLWPHWPYLPLKRSVKKHGIAGTEFQCAFLDANARDYKKGHYQLYLGFIFAPQSATKSTVYTSLQAVLDDGWLVD
jgi:hypothetical protein